MAKLYGIDVSSNQPADIVRKVVNDFAIVKLTGNPQAYDWNYVNPYAAQQARDAMEKHGRLGLYHFTWGKISPETEADFFVQQVKALGYLGKAVLVIDYEAQAVRLGRSWVDAFAKRVEKLAGYKPVIYASGSVIINQNLFALGWPIWCANYSRGYETISGYDPRGCTIYDGCENSILWQYTSSGILGGYDGTLDCNVFYGDDKAWKRLAGLSTDGGGATSKTKFGTRAKVIEIARGQLKQVDGTKYGQWYEDNVDKNAYNYNYGGYGVPWCAMFVSWCFNQAKAACVGLPGAYCPDMLKAARNAGKTVKKADARRGDVVFFDWNGNGVADHVGIITKNDVKNGCVHTIEGNADNGQVLRKWRDYDYICGIVRPDYKAQDSDAQPDEGGTPVSKTVAFRLSTDPLGVKWLAVGKKAKAKGEYIRWIAIKGVKYRVCTQRSGWLPYVDAYNIKDLESGCAGDGSPITAVQVVNGDMRYSVRVRGNVWYADMLGTYDTGGTSDNFAGDMQNPIDGFRIERDV